MEFPLHPAKGDHIFSELTSKSWEFDGEKWKKAKKPSPPEIAPVLTRAPDIWPSDPIVGEQVTGLDGRRWQWDGEKWVGVAWVPTGGGPAFEWPPLGVTDGSDAEAGYVGEVLEFHIEHPTGAAGPQPNSTFTYITVTIPSGDWETSGVFYIHIEAAALMGFAGGITGHGSIRLATDYDQDSTWAKSQIVSVCPAHITTQTTVTGFYGIENTIIAPASRLSLTAPATISFIITSTVFLWNPNPAVAASNCKATVWARRVR